MSSETSSDEGCYLVYESDSSGKLMLYYSKTKVANAIGFWKPGQGKKIQVFKFKKNQGRSELAKGCSGGVAGRKMYYSGWLQFIKLAKLMNGTVVNTPLDGVGLNVDLYAYRGQGPIKFEENIPFETIDIEAIACVPKDSDVFEDISKIDMIRFLDLSNQIGSSTATR